MGKPYIIRKDRYRSLVPPDSKGRYRGIAFVFKDARDAERMFAGETWGFMYHGTSLGHPTVRTFEEAMTEGEAGGRPGFDTLATASGMSALVLFLLHMRYTTGKNEVIFSSSVYGGVYHLLTELLPKTCGFVCHAVDNVNDGSTWKKLVNDRTICVLVESPSNPMARVFGLEWIGWVARRWGVLSVVDNTVATFALQKPLNFGVDVVINSVTKSINGSSTALGGTITARSELIRELRAGWGAGGRPVMHWQAAELMLAGLRDLPRRMERCSQNAEALINYLTGHDALRNICYPNSPDAHAQMFRGGGLVALELLHTERENAYQFLNSLQAVPIAPHLGHSATIAIHPASTTHSRVPADVRERIGITEGVIRVSVGIESERAFKRVLTDLRHALDTFMKRPRRRLI